MMEEGLDKVVLNKLKLISKPPSLIIGSPFCINIKTQNEILVLDWWENMLNYKIHINLFLRL